MKLGLHVPASRSPLQMGPAQNHVFSAHHAPCTAVYTPRIIMSTNIATAAAAAACIEHGAAVAAGSSRRCRAAAAAAGQTVQQHERPTIMHTHIGRVD